MRTTKFQHLLQRPMRADDILPLRKLLTNLVISRLFGMYAAIGGFCACGCLSRDFRIPTELHVVKPPPFVASLRFETSLKTQGSGTIPPDDSFSLELCLEWSIWIHDPEKVFYFPGFVFNPAALLSAFTPQSAPLVLLDYSDTDPLDNVLLEVVDHDTRTIAWHHHGLKGLVRTGFAPHETNAWEALPNPLYFRKLHNQHVPRQFAHAVSQLVRAFPGRVKGAYTPEMQQAVSAFIGEELPPPRLHS